MLYFCFSGQIDKGKVRIRDISLYVIHSDVEFVLKRIDRTKLTLKILEQMVIARLCLEEDVDTVAFLWMSGNGSTCTLKKDSTLMWWWDHAKVNEKGCIELKVKITVPGWANEGYVTPKKTPVSKKTASKSPATVRKSPRVAANKNKSARNLFGFSDSGDCSHPTPETVVLDEEPNVVHVQPEEEQLDKDDDLVDDDFVVQLENRDVDECHPVEDPEKAAAYSSDEDNEEAMEKEFVNNRNKQQNDGDNGDEGNCNEDDGDNGDEGITC